MPWKIVASLYSTNRGILFTYVQNQDWQESVKSRGRAKRGPKILVYIYIYIYKSMYVHIYIYISKWMNEYRERYTCVYICVCVCSHLYLYIYIWRYMRYVDTHIYIYIYGCRYIHKYMHMDTWIRRYITTYDTYTGSTLT